jgi:hypothetical protein
VKGWFFWNWLGKILPGGLFDSFTPKRYKDIVSAEIAAEFQLDLQETMRLSRQIKKIEIIDNKVNTDKDQILISSDDLDRKWGIRFEYVGLEYVLAISLKPLTPAVRIVIFGCSVAFGRIRQPFSKKNGAKIDAKIDAMIDIAKSLENKMTTNMHNNLSQTLWSTYDNS